VTRADGGPFASPVPFALSKGGATRLTGVLDNSGGVWRATVDAGADDGARGLYAGWDGGPYITGTFKVTATPPTIALVPETAPARAPNQTDGDGNPRWKKSEVAPVKVTSNRDLLAAPVPADFSNASVATSTRCTSCAAPRCYCFEVDLAPEAFTQAAPGTLYGAVQVSLNKPLVDALGNSGNAAQAAVDITRFKWSQVVATLSASSPTAIALSSSGLVLAGASVGVTSALTALSPDGGIAWQKSYSSEAITAGPLIGTTGAFVAVNNGTQGQLRRLSLADGTTFTPDRCLAANLTYQGDMALASPGAGEFPVAVASDGTITGATNTAHCTSTSLGSTSATSTLIVSGDAAYAALDGQDPIWKFTMLSATPTAEGQISTGTLFPANLFSFGTTLVGGGGGPTIGGVFAFMDTGGTLSGATTNKTPGAKPAGAAVVGGSSAAPLVYFGDNNGGHIYEVPLAVGPVFGTEVDSGQLATTDFSKRAPLYGANGHLYVAGTGADKALRALNATTLVEEWSWTAPNAIAGQLNLDKNRDAARPCDPGQPGVLYVVTASGSAATLNAILVDSPGVDPAAPWPRYQHDPGNTGNPATDLSA
jgi:hypothetical protein